MRVEILHGPLNHDGTEHKTGTVLDLPDGVAEGLMARKPPDRPRIRPVARQKKAKAAKAPKAVE
mgnify:CR=1 FL=1|tara:strand:- start:728 stop:919 length:192 start_codon:yes stop_codon:yes gene_type:complete